MHVNSSNSVYISVWCVCVCVCVCISVWCVCVYVCAYMHTDQLYNWGTTKEDVYLVKKIRKPPLNFKATS